MKITSVLLVATNPLRFLRYRLPLHYVRSTTSNNVYYGTVKYGMLQRMWVL